MPQEQTSENLNYQITIIFDLRGHPLIDFAPLKKEMVCLKRENYCGKLLPSLIFFPCWPYMFQPLWNMPEKEAGVAIGHVTKARKSLLYDKQCCHAIVNWIQMPGTDINRGLHKICKCK